MTTCPGQCFGAANAARVSESDGGREGRIDSGDSVSDVSQRAEGANQWLSRQIAVADAVWGRCRWGFRSLPSLRVDCVEMSLLRLTAEAETLEQLSEVVALARISPVPRQLARRLPCT
jgi:hypothetical protein